ncbi:MAG: WXG100 family type VII secretion target [Frankia sp.]
MLDLDGDPTPGDPFGIRELARRFLSLAADATDASGRVRAAAGSDAVGSWVGDAGDAYREQIGALPGDLDKLSTSYGIAGRALTSYAASLDGAQDQADRALSSGREARGRLTSAQTALSTARSADRSTSQALDAARSPALVSGAPAHSAPDPAAVSAAVRNHNATATRLTQAQASVDNTQDDLAAARRLAMAAKALREDAESTAERQLHAASDAGIPNKKWWQKLGDSLAKGWHVLVKIAKVVVLVLGVVALIIGGPLAWIVFAAALVVLADTLVKYSQGKATLWDVGLAALACIPMTKGLTGLGEIRTVLAEGEGILGAGRLVIQGGSTQLREMASALRGLDQAGAASAVKLFSRAPNVANVEMLTSGAGLPRTVETVASYATRAEVDLGGTALHIIDDMSEARYLDHMGAVAYTPAEKLGSEIRFGPASFVDEETLVKTIAHEKVHVDQLRGGTNVSTENLDNLEDAAYAVEEGVWQRFLGGGS